MPQPSRDKAAKSGNVALAGRDGERLTALVAKAQAQGAAALFGVMEPAARRLARQGSAAAHADRLFTAPELSALQDVLARTIATGSGLGHFRIRERQQKATAAGGLHRFADEQPFAVFGSVASEGIPLLSPSSAVEYFRSLIPTIGVDVVRWAPTMYRTAWTLAAATETTLLKSVKALILDRLATGRGYTTAPADIDALLDGAGVGPRNPQYAQMVFRTNAMDAYNVGLALELESPDVAPTFPAWQYFGIRDGRQGEDHEPRFNKYYPNSLPFPLVRGDRPYNCRCTFAPVDRWHWADLTRQGVSYSGL